MARLSLIGALFAVGHAALGIALPLWPPPTSLVVQDASTASISAAFAVHLTGAGSGSGIAQRAVQRYQSIIAISTTPAGGLRAPGVDCRGGGDRRGVIS